MSSKIEFSDRERQIIAKIKERIDNFEEEIAPKTSIDLSAYLNYIKSVSTIDCSDSEEEVRRLEKSIGFLRCNKCIFRDTFTGKDCCSDFDVKSKIFPVIFEMLENKLIMKKVKEM